MVVADTMVAADTTDAVVITDAVVTDAVAIMVAVAGTTDAVGMVLTDTSVVAPPTADEARQSLVAADTTVDLAADSAAVMADSAVVVAGLTVVVVDSAAVAVATAAAAHTAADIGNSAYFSRSETAGRVASRFSLFHLSVQAELQATECCVSHRPE